VLRRYTQLVRERDPLAASAWRGLVSAWSFRR
jgi:hypothetical protein